MMALGKTKPLGTGVLIWLAAGLMMLCLTEALRAAPAPKPLIVDLSKHRVAITTAFTGTEVLLFGAFDGEGDVAIVVRGPEREAVVRRKSRVAGIWVNTKEMTFHKAPSFYYVAASRPLAELGSSDLLDSMGLGVAHLGLDPAPGEQSATDVAIFRKALIRNKRQFGLYGKKPGSLLFLGNRLFRTDIYFPANVPVGEYLVEVFLIRDGQVASRQTTPLLVNKSGVGAEVFDFAHEYAPYYGLVAIVIAMMTGWLAGAVFRKV
jgi:uncharacterized protein (TIGR02186 family)